MPHRRRLLMLVPLTLLCAWSLPGDLAHAQEYGSYTYSGRQETTSREDLPKEQEQLYGGIIPGKRDGVAHVQNATSSKKRQINWIGFTPESTRTRVFIQATSPTDYQMSRSEDGTQIILTFPNTRVENFNLIRFIDATYFDRAIKRIDATRKRKTVTVTMTVEPGTNPDVTRTDNYIYFDFPHEGGPPKEEASNEAQTDVFRDDGGATDFGEPQG